MPLTRAFGAEVRGGGAAADQGPPPRCRGLRDGLGHNGRMSEGGERFGAFAAGARLVVSAARCHPRPFWISVVGASAFAVLTVAYAWALGRIVDRVLVPAFDGGVSGGVVARTLGLFGAIAVARALCVVIRRSFAGRWQHAVAASHRRDVVDRLLTQPVAWLRRRGTGDLLAVADNDPETAIAMLSPFPYSVGSIVLVVVAAGWLLVVDPVIGAVAVLVMPLVAISNIVFVRRAERPATVVQAAVGHLSDSILETVDGIAVVKALGAQPVRRRLAAERIESLRVAKLRQIRLQVGFDAAMELVPSAIEVALVFIGAWRVRDGRLEIGQVVSVIQLFERLVWPLRMLAYAAAALPRSVAGRARIDTVVGAPLVPLPVSDPTRSAEAVIELEDVRVVHDDGRVALDGVDLTIRRGRRIAIVGATGAGKTTLLHVLAGIEAPTTGRVRRSTPRALPVLVFQEPLLFAGPISNCVTMGAAIGPDDMAAALRRSRSEFVHDLPSGLDTLVGERGVTLSGGQRQRLALARALARRPDVLLLDDTTASLDPTTEADVLQALGDPDVATTVVLVAARPASIALADEVVLLEDGRVTATGTHDELLASSPVYRELVSAYAVVAVGAVRAAGAGDG